MQKKSSRKLRLGASNTDESSSAPRSSSKLRAVRTNKKAEKEHN